MSKNIRTEEVDHLFDAILCLKDKEECYAFFEDVCTVMNCFQSHRDMKLPRCFARTAHIVILPIRPGHPPRR